MLTSGILTSVISQPGEAVDMCHLRSKLHDEPLTSLDLSSNDVQAEGAGLLAEVLTARGWKIKELILDGNNLREQVVFLICVAQSLCVVWC